jgi:hypothetical protein
MDAGVATTLATYNVTLANNDKIGMRCFGTSIDARHYTGGAWALLGSVLDATYSGIGYNGIWAQTDSAGTGAIPLAEYTSGMKLVGAFPNMIDTDYFTRPDEGPPPSQTEWSDMHVMGVISNRCAVRQTPNSYTTPMIWRTMFAKDQEVHTCIPVRQVDLRIISIFSRFQDWNNFIYCCIIRDDGGNDEIQVVHMVAGVAISVGGPYTITYQNGDSIGLRDIDDTVEIWYKSVGGSWGSLGVETTPLVAAGYVGLIADDTTVRFSNFGGGSYAPGCLSGGIASILRSIDGGRRHRLAYEG